MMMTKSLVTKALLVSGISSRDSEQKVLNKHGTIKEFLDASHFMFSLSYFTVSPFLITIFVHKVPRLNL
jgi:hypothetical protein